MKNKSKKRIQKSLKKNSLRKKYKKSLKKKKGGSFSCGNDCVDDDSQIVVMPSKPIDKPLPPITNHLDHDVIVRIFEELRNIRENQARIQRIQRIQNTTAEGIRLAQRNDHRLNSLGSVRKPDNPSIRVPDDANYSWQI